MECKTITDNLGCMKREIKTPLWAFLSIQCFLYSENHKTNAKKNCKKRMKVSIWTRKFKVIDWFNKFRYLTV